MLCQILCGSRCLFIGYGSSSAKQNLHTDCVNVKDGAHSWRFGGGL